MRDASVQCSRDVAAKNCSDYQLLIHTAVPGPYLCSTELSINIVTWRAHTGQGKLNWTFASWPPYPYPTFSALPLSLADSQSVRWETWERWLEAVSSGDRWSAIRGAPTHTLVTVETVWLLKTLGSHDPQVFIIITQATHHTYSLLNARPLCLYPGPPGLADYRQCTVQDMMLC